MSKTASPSQPSADALLTIVEIARHFSLPESTARYYCKRFAAFIPCCGEGRRRRFRQEVLPVIETILEVMRTARTASAVEAELEQRFPRNAEEISLCVKPALTVSSVDTHHQPDSTGLALQTDLPALAVHLLQQQSQALETIGSALQMMAKRQEELDRLSQLAENAAQENEHLRREVHQLRQQVYATESLQQSDLEQLRTWMGRLVRTRAAGATADK